MAAYFSPVGNEVQTDSNGDPLNGGKIYTYVAGTSTPQDSYTSSSGGTAQANPIVLNSSGLPANPIWLAEGVSYKFVITDSSDAVLRTIDGVTGVNDPSFSSTVSEWTPYADDPTYISATSFSVTGDQTNTFQVGRRIRSTNTGGTIYSSITASSYSAGTGLTTVTVANDSGSLDSGLSAVSYALLSVTNPSFPRASSAQAAAGTSNEVILTPSSLKQGQIVSGTTQSLSSGTAKDWTDIPSWVKRVTVHFWGLSTNGTAVPRVQIGDSGGIETTGYLGAASQIPTGGNPTSSNFTTSFGLTGLWSAATVLHGKCVIELADAATNTWVATVTGGQSNITSTVSGGGSKSLSGTLTQVRLTMDGTDTFDAGSASLTYE
jgi:hypothetical protein